MWYSVIYVYIFVWMNIVMIWGVICIVYLWFEWVFVYYIYIYFEILFILVLLKNKVLFIWWFCIGLELLDFLVDILNIFCRFGGFIILMVDIVLKYLLRFWFLKLKL